MQPNIYILIPYECICKKFNLLIDKKYKVLDITNIFNESLMDLFFKIKNEDGEFVWIDNWSCEEVSRYNRW